MNTTLNASDVVDTAQLRALPSTAGERRAKPVANEAAIESTAQDFESVFLSQMMEHMFASVPVNETFGGGQAEEIYRSFMMNEYGKLISRAGGIGIADYVKHEMLRLQEVGAKHG